MVGCIRIEVSQAFGGGSWKTWLLAGLQAPLEDGAGNIGYRVYVDVAFIREKQPQLSQGLLW